MRFGMDMQLPRAFDRMTWYGRGPFENYWDRKTAADVGRYTSSVADQYVPYTRPQENGNKTDVRWVALTNDAGVGLLAVAQPHLSVSAHHNVLEDFVSPEAGYKARHETENRHTMTYLRAVWCRSTWTTARWVWAATTPGAARRSISIA